jgi:plastocyanin
MRHGRILIAVLLLGLAVVVAGCSGSGTSTTGETGTPPASSSSGESTSTGGATIMEQDFAFSPSTLTVKLGETVTFTNNDSAPHIVKIDGKELGNQNQGESTTWTATKAGSFPYICTLHPAMTGEITVQ